MTKEMKTEVFKQGDMINKIDDNILNVVENVEKADNEIISADKDEKKTSCGRIFIILIILIVVIGIVLLIIFLTKK